MIGIIDYGLGNISAFSNIYKSLGIKHVFVKKESDFEGVDRIILPGVGAFDHAMDSLNQSGLREPLEKLVIVNKLPILGVCVGMQMMANNSDEGSIDGLGWIAGSVKKFTDETVDMVPHMGWNDATTCTESDLFDGLLNPSFYFLHSYYFEPKYSSNTLAKTEYGNNFACSVFNENIFGVQFHPEKSHSDGITLLKNFSEI